MDPSQLTLRFSAVQQHQSHGVKLMLTSHGRGRGGSNEETAAVGLSAAYRLSFSTDRDILSSHSAADTARSKIMFFNLIASSTLLTSTSRPPTCISVADRDMAAAAAMPTRNWMGPLLRAELLVGAGSGAGVELTLCKACWRQYTKRHSMNDTVSKEARISAANKEPTRSMFSKSSSPKLQPTLAGAGGK